MLKKMIVMKFINSFGSAEIASAMEKYTQEKSEFYQGNLAVEPSTPLCPKGVDIYDNLIWAYSLNLYNYFFFTTLGTVALLAMLGHVVMRLFLAIIS